VALTRGQAAAEPERPLSIFCFDYAKGIKTVEVKRGKSDFTPVTLSTANIVEAGEVAVEDGTISLFGSPDEAGERPVVASSQAGEIREPMMILVPAGEEVEPAYRTHVLDRGLKQLPLGGTCFVNLSPHPLRVRLGEEVIAIDPAAQHLVLPRVAAGEVMSVTIDYKPGDQWLAVSSSRWAHRLDRRSIVVVHLNPLTGRIQMKSIPLRDQAGAPGGR
jgi:hypothetical protein